MRDHRRVGKMRSEHRELAARFGNALGLRRLRRVSVDDAGKR
jgi:hypothetical protein